MSTSLADVIEEQGVLLDLGTSHFPCEGSTFHSPKPLATFAVLRSDIFDNGDVGLKDVLHLCGTCRENLRVFVALSIASNGGLAWEVRRQFGNTIRMLGQSIWSEYHVEDEAASG